MEQSIAKEILNHLEANRISTVLILSLLTEIKAKLEDKSPEIVTEEIKEKISQLLAALQTQIK
jgi:predicted ATP-grasp superfamily ATP-dependent carboligase